MYCNSHTLDTMFANKLVDCKARYDKIAGRGFYDIYQFFLQGLDINTKVVEGKVDVGYVEYLESLISFIGEHLTNRLLNQDLNPLKGDIVIFLQDEISRHTQE